MRHLIELVHLADHPAERAALVRSLGTLGAIFVVPALHAELHAPHAVVRRAAVEAIGALGYAFGGAAVARWLEARDLELEPPGMADAALLTLARTGHPDTAAWAERLWEEQRVEARTVHLALAEEVSPRLVELARHHVSSPDAGIAAALHLSALRTPELPRLLRPLLRSSDIEQVHVAERMLAAQHGTAEEDMLALLGRRWEDAPLRRAARRLRVHPVEELVEAFEVLRDDCAAGTWERRGLAKTLLLAGIPQLQRAVLGWLVEADEARDLAWGLRCVGVPHEGLDGLLGRLVHHADDDVAVQALRTRVNVYGRLTPDDLAALSSSPRPALRCEAVRSLMTLYRDRRRPDRRTGLSGKARRAAEAMLRSALREGDPPTRSLAAYTVGNLGTTALTDGLHRLRDDGEVGVRQGAAASLHALPSSVPADALLAWAQSEPDADVRFRLGLSLLRALDAGDQPDPAALQRLVDGGLSDRADLAVLALRLRGHLTDQDSHQQLISAASDGRLATAAAAITALGVQARSSALPALATAAQADDPVRRRRAAEALRGFPSDAAAEVLLALACDDPDLPVRRAALETLVARPCDAAQAARLRPTDPDDPLVFEVLQARAAAGAGGLDAAAVDSRLEAAMPGFRAERLARLAPDALQALRTAAFLDAGVSMPAGLDAAPPALFWVKGLELWLSAVMRPLQSALRRTEAREALDGAAYRWSALHAGVEGWPPSAPRG
jgi:HEAT repeat protein